MNQHQDRTKIEGIVNYLDPHNKDINPLQRLIVQKFQMGKDDKDQDTISLEALLTPDLISLILQKIQIELSLDIRDALYELNRQAGVTKWGSKLGASASTVEHKLADPAKPIFEQPENIIPSDDSVSQQKEKDPGS